MLGNVTFHQKCKDDVYKIWHTNEGLMIIRTYSNGGSIVIEDGTYPITPNMICLMGTNIFHYTMPEDPDTYDRTKLFISREQFSIVQKLISDDCFLNRITENSFIYALLDDEGILLAERIFGDVKRAYMSGNYATTALLSAFARLLTLIDRFSVYGKSSEDYISKAVEFIGTHITENIKIDMICRNIHMSKYYFCRKFKERIGITVGEYILKTRLMLAKNMLSKYQKSISEISEDCGFSSISYFCRVFKEETGMSPAKYRKRVHNESCRTNTPNNS